MNKIPKITVPLSPLVRKGENEPIKTKRLKHEDALDLENLTKELKKSTIYTKCIENHPWSIIPTVSSYSPYFHVMLMETSKNRYLPSIEYISNSEGESLKEIIGKTIEFIRDNFSNQRIFLGYNWSPRSWGTIEQKGGFQSIPTKWHLMIFTLPYFDNSFTSDEYISFIDDQNNEKNKEYYEIFKKFNGENDFSKDLINNLKIGLDEIKNNNGFKGRSYGENGAYLIEFDLQIDELIKKDGFFSNFLKPIAKYLDDYFTNLTDLFIDDKKLKDFFNENLEKDENLYSDSWCEIIDNVLKKTSNRKLSKKEYEFIKKLPPLKDDISITRLLKSKGFSSKAIDELLKLVKSRYALDSSYTWKKGFAYALVIEENKNKTILKIAPGAYNGPGGIVETQKILLNRIEHSSDDNEKLKKKSEKLYELGEKLKKI
ncbi:hypothetical protein [Methanobrevibacter sp. DSM 116169]|uniref:hypothetical protein n=1 Tax=Methanobrevibacter sp. DSM 116169 TaxID=3242727 RepID=UPI0038FC6CA7